MNPLRGRSPIMTCFITWVALMAFLALTFGSSYLPMGEWNTAINMAISGAKAALIAAVFMHLRHAGTLLRVAAVAGLLWLALLFGISSTDYATRQVSPAPWSSPQ
jgi:cytochrome c oxidase subunit 4